MARIEHRVEDAILAFGNRIADLRGTSFEATDRLAGKVNDYFKSRINLLYGKSGVELLAMLGGPLAAPKLAEKFNISIDNAYKLASKMGDVATQITFDPRSSDNEAKYQILQRLMQELSTYQQELVRNMQNQDSAWQRIQQTIAQAKQGG